MTLVSTYPADFRNLYKGLQSHQVNDLKQQVSVLLEKQLSGRFGNAYASLINLPIATQVPALSALSALSNLSLKSSTKQHPPLTASNSVANCNAASHLKAVAVREHRKLDRSASEPADKSQSRLVAPTSSRYKTELCRPFEESGTCKYGDKCQFAHGHGELRTLSRHPKYKTELCRTFHSTGFCPYGPRCHFIHNSDDSKKCLLNTLQGSHAPAGGCPPRDICGFSIGSAGDLSPASSISSGSPTSSICGFFLDECGPPQTAPPTLTHPRFFGSDYVQLKPLASLVPQEELLASSPGSDISMVIPEMEYNSLVDTASCTSSSDSDPESLDGNRNIRLPVFHQLSLGSP